MFLQKHPRTPLRVFCIAAFEYLARFEQGTLGRKRRGAIALACDFGSVRDEFYDERKLNRAEYRLLRRELRAVAPEAATSKYIRELRRAERERPVLATGEQGVAAATIHYRERVIRISLRWMAEISGTAVERGRFDSMVNLICLMQLVDDLLDWKEDALAGCPSYVTAHLQDHAAGIRTRLRGVADGLLEKTVQPARQDAGTLPFALAGVVTWGMVVGLLAVRRFGK